MTKLDRWVYRLVAVVMAGAGTAAMMLPPEVSNGVPGVNFVVGWCGAIVAVIASFSGARKG